MKGRLIDVVLFTGIVAWLILLEVDAHVRRRA